MIFLRLLSFLLLTALFMGCGKHSDPLTQLLEQSEDPAIKKVMADPSKYELQIHYSQIDSTEEGIRFTDYRFGGKNDGYFYPASTVKLPMALMAASFMNEQGLPLSTPYWIAGDTLAHSVADDIRQILAVSDNEAYNRLYELIGRDHVNKEFARMDLRIWIAHRLSTPDAAIDQRKELHFVVGKDTLILGGGTDRELLPNLQMGTIKGKGYMQGDSLVNSPMDFSFKNNYPLSSQHELLKRLFFPDLYPEEQRFKLRPEDQDLIIRSMYQVPRFQGYDESEYYDGYVKFFMYGATRQRMPENIRIHNKVGYAYGTLTDAAYIVDSQTGVQFMLSATLLVNEDEIFNDDVYQYDTVGIPFLAALGQAVYNMELERRENP